MQVAKTQSITPLTFHFATFNINLFHVKQIIKGVIAIEYELFKKSDEPKIYILNTHGGQMYQNEKNKLIASGAKKVGTVNTELTLHALDTGLSWRCGGNE